MRGESMKEVGEQIIRATSFPALQVIECTCIDRGIVERLASASFYGDSSGMLLLIHECCLNAGYHCASAGTFAAAT